MNLAEATMQFAVVVRHMTHLSNDDEEDFFPKKCKLKDVQKHLESSDVTASLDTQWLVEV
ncbi:CLUMA_CG010779, isoform A [Clunio marinus]|uniref:CLUMA_CG010779, isoform A n=1 Tax=Clunio marinus TaxID=568069 RepID=A0A1J1IAS3_9DIPT|nr:CLUMA_CG010779, isoform A [Clunio marinus]